MMSDIQTNEDKQKAVADSESSPAEPTDRRKLPLSTNLKLVYIFSLIIAFLTAATAVGSIVFRDKVYPADWIIQSFLPNDIVTLLIGLPILLGSMLLAYRGSLIGLLFWPGALFYGLYNYFIYLLGMPFGVMYVIHMTIVTLSTYTLIGLIASIDGAAVKKRLVGNVPEKLGGGVLFLAGDAFALLALIAIETAEISDHNLPPAELALSTADFIASAAWIIGGVLLWRKKPLGYVAGPGLLFNIAMLFVGLLIVLLLQPLLADVAFSAPDFIVILIMTIISFIPLALFIRGIRKAGATKPVASR
ncbi:MAG: hypothetical protein ACK2T3_16875 [Candidatus Promineifilaceae bacterium]|jgi:hypothetical protein